MRHGQRRPDFHEYYDDEPKHGERRRNSQGNSYYAQVELKNATWYSKEQIFEVKFRKHEGLDRFGFSKTAIKPYKQEGESYQALANRFVQDYNLRIFGNQLPNTLSLTSSPSPSEQEASDILVEVEILAGLFDEYRVQTCCVVTDATNPSLPFVNITLFGC